MLHKKSLLESFVIVPQEFIFLQSIKACYNTWGDYTPLFHYSESAPGNNPRKHANYAMNLFETHGLDFNLDFELKEKCLAIHRYRELYDQFKQRI